MNGNYASIGRRFVALFLDGLILFIPHLVMNHIIPFGGSLIIWGLYAPVLESSELQATIGKHLMGIQVADLSGHRISFWAALIRAFMKIVSSLLLCLGYLLAFFTERKQSLHDLIAETTVIYGRSERAIPDAWVAQIRQIFQTGEKVFSDPHLSGPSRSKATELERLARLKEQGILTEEEFQLEKKRILSEN